MEACEVVRLFVNKTMVSAEPKRRGNPGYGRLRAVRVLVYARLKGFENDTRVVEHLRRHTWTARRLGFSSVPDRTTVGRWWRRYLGVLEETFEKISNMLQLVTPSTFLIADSTPLEDLYDMEARWGYTSRGKFRGFKLHAVVNQLGLPLRATVTPGNRYDSPFLPSLLEDLEADYVLADAGYDSKRNTRAVRSIGADPVIAPNPRKGKRKRIKHGVLLKTKRYLIEQFNGHIKANVLKKCWVRPRGLVKKAAMVTAGLICCDAEAIKSMILGEESLKSLSKYWA
jgi:transposase